MKIWAIPTAIAVTDHDAALDGRIARPGQPALTKNPFSDVNSSSNIWIRGLDWEPPAISAQP